MAFSFSSQNNIGLQGEALILEHYHTKPLTKMDEKHLAGDFIRPDGKIVEVKTDTYPLARTPNFFFEYHSNLDKKTPGGPWRALLESTDFFVYLYLHDKTYFEFSDLKKLVVATDKYIKLEKLRPQRILNKSHITTGYKIPRAVVEDLCVMHVIKQA